MVWRAIQGIRGKTTATYWKNYVLSIMYLVCVHLNVCWCGVMMRCVVLSSNKPNTLIIKHHKLRTIAIFAGRQTNWTRVNIIESLASPPYFGWISTCFTVISNDWKSTNSHKPTDKSTRMYAYTQTPTQNTSPKVFDYRWIYQQHTAGGAQSFFVHSLPAVIFLSFWHRKLPISYRKANKNRVYRCDGFWMSLLCGARASYCVRVRVCVMCWCAMCSALSLFIICVLATWRGKFLSISNENGQQ